MELVTKAFSELSARELYEILRLRVSVFVVEQNCPYQELDGVDLRALHLVLRDEEGIAAYCRVMDRGVVHPCAAIGRVIAARRRQGLGTRILREGIRTVRERFRADRIWLEAQSWAQPFYARQGFRRVSDEFMEDGIPHVEMLLDCADFDALPDAGGAAGPNIPAQGDCRR